MAEELTGGEKPWGEDGMGSSWRATRLRDWCSAHSKRDPATLDAQLAFLTYEIRTVFGKLQTKLNDATTVEAAQEAISPYFDKLREKKNGLTR